MNARERILEAARRCAAQGSAPANIIYVPTTTYEYLVEWTQQTHAEDVIRGSGLTYERSTTLISMLQAAIRLFHRRNRTRRFDVDDWMATHFPRPEYVTRKRAEAASRSRDDAGR